MLTGPVSSKPLLTTLYSRYLLIADGTGKSKDTQLYDTLTWQVVQGSPPLPIKPSSLAYVDNYTGSDASYDGSVSVAALLTVGQDGGWRWLDLTDSTSADAEVILDASVPPGGQLSDVAGGQTLTTTSGMLYIVGATRQSGKATNAVLRISPNGVPSWATLTTARLGAAAAWVDGVGLCVFGGTSSGDAGAHGMNGVEILPDGDNSATLPQPGLPADTTNGRRGAGTRQQPRAARRGSQLEGKAGSGALLHDHRLDRRRGQRRRRHLACPPRHLQDGASLRLDQRGVPAGLVLRAGRRDRVVGGRLRLPADALERHPRPLPRPALARAGHPLAQLQPRRGRRRLRHPGELHPLSRRS